MSIFTGIKVGKHQLKHRVVLAPLTRLRNKEDGVPKDIVAEYYEQRASEGGLLIAEGTLTSHGGKPVVFPGIYTQDQIEGWKKITNAVHRKKGIIYSQIVHLGRTGASRYSPDHAPAVSASAIGIQGDNMNGEPHEVPRALEENEIQSLVKEFTQAALNSIEAGFDGVEVHAANGFLIDQFITVSSNQRTDKYGGSIENRARFALEVLEAVTNAIGQERTAIRFSPGNNFQDMYDDNFVETFVYLTTEIQRRFPNLSYLHFIQTRSNILIDDKKSIGQDTLQPYREIWKGPFVSAGSYSYSGQQSIEFAEKTGDLIAFGRIFISNPDLPLRLKNNWPLTPYDRATFYTNDGKGYIDYPFYQDQKN